jgi:hypothetical protein
VNFNEITGAKVGKKFDSSHHSVFIVCSRFCRFLSIFIDCYRFSSIFIDSHRLKPMAKMRIGLKPTAGCGKGGFSPLPVETRFYRVSAIPAGSTCEKNNVEIP